MLTVAALFSIYPFNSKVVKQKACWIWNGARTKNGYGHGIWKGKLAYVHRAVYEELNGPIPKGMCVCHKCDVPFCVNPSHLFLATQSGNIDDMHKKMRHRFGENHPLAKLTRSVVKKIRSEYKTGKTTCVKLGVKYSVSPSLIGFVIKGTIWKEVV